MRWSAIIFDLDDTLYAERDFVRSGYEAVARWSAAMFKLDAEQAFAELWQDFLAGVRGDSFDRWLRNRDLAQHWLPEMIRIYREHAPRITPFAEVHQLLTQLQREVRLGLVSDGEQPVQQRKLEALGLAECFESIAMSSQLGRDAWKPSPRGLQFVLDELAVAGQDAIYIADNPRKDFRAARAAKMSSARVRLPVGLYHDLEPAAASDAADFEFNDYESLSQFLLTDRRPGARLLETGRSPSKGDD